MKRHSAPRHSAKLVFRIGGAVDRGLIQGSIAALQDVEATVNDVLPGVRGAVEYDQVIQTRLRPRLEQLAQAQRVLESEYAKVVQRRPVVAPVPVQPEPAPVPIGTPGWNELPLDTDRSVSLSISLAQFQSQLLAFFERQMLRDERLKRTVCWIFPSAAMLEHQASVYVDLAASSLLSDSAEYIQKRVAACGAQLVVLTIKFSSGATYAVLVNRTQRTAELLWVAGPRLPQEQLARQVVSSVLPGFFASSFEVRVAENSCTGASFPAGSLGCLLLETAVWYLKLLNPDKGSREIVQHVGAECAKSGTAGCFYLGDFLRFVEKSNGHKPPFRNVPLASLSPAELSKFGKFRQSSTSMLLYIEYIAYQLERQQRKLICVPSTLGLDDPFHEFRVVDPSLVQQYGSINRLVRNAAPADLLQDIAACVDRFYLVPLHIRYIRQAPTGPVGPTTSLDQFSEGHANVLLFDNRRRTLFRYEPNGPPHDAKQERETAWIDAYIQGAIVEPLKRLGRPYTYETSVQVCPNIPGAQSLQQQLGPGGFCVAWSTMFMVLVMLNPEWSIEDIQQRMLLAGQETAGNLTRQERGQLLLAYIQKFVRAMDCVTGNLDTIGEGTPQHLALVRKLRETGVLRPVQCSGGGVDQKLATLSFVERVYCSLNTFNQSVFVAARTTCGFYVTTPPFALQIDRSLPFVECRTNAPLNSRPPGSGSGQSLQDPYVLALSDDPGTPFQKLLLGIQAAEAYAKLPPLTTLVGGPSCPSPAL